MASKKRKPVRARFDNLEEVTYEALAKSQILKDLVIGILPEAIEEAMGANKHYAQLFEINTSSSYVDIHKRDWVPALESCLAYYIAKEDYDTCRKITVLIESIKLKKQGLKIKTPKEDGGELQQG
jgi:hypothetical protein